MTTATTITMTIRAPIAHCPSAFALSIQNCTDSLSDMAKLLRRAKRLFSARYTIDRKPGWSENLNCSGGESFGISTQALADASNIDRRLFTSESTVSTAAIRRSKRLYPEMFGGLG